MTDFKINITFDGEPLEEIVIPIPRLCSYCQKEAGPEDTLCNACWMPLDAEADQNE